MPIDKDKWQSAFERQLDIAEKKQIAIVKRFYNVNTTKALNPLLQTAKQISNYYLTIKIY
jgi:hypothetical protein